MKVRARNQRPRTPVAPDPRPAAKPPSPPGLTPGQGWLLLGLAVLVHGALLASNLGRPFSGANEDDNAVFGLGASNLARFGFLASRFGIAANWCDSAPEIAGRFYTHHPQWLIVPTALLYRMFGVSDALTRVPSMVLSLVSLVALFLIVRGSGARPRVAAISALVYAILPGVVHFSSSLSEKAFVLGFSNLLILSFFLLIRRGSASARWWFLSVLFAGGFIGWHFDLAAVALWVYVALDSKLPHRRFLLVSLPAVAALTVALNFLHFHLLRGGGPREILDILRVRTQPMPPGFFLGKYRFLLETNFTPVGAAVAVGALIYRLVRAALDRRLSLPLLFAIQPLLVLVLFQEWSGHAFGPIYWAPFVALAIGQLLEGLLERRGWIPKVVAAAVAVLFVILIPGKTMLFRQPLLVTDSDIRLLKRFGAETPAAARIGVQPDPRRLCSIQVAEWYARRNLHRHDFAKDTLDVVLGFNPEADPAFRPPFERLLQSGYRVSERGGYYLVLQRR